MIACFQGNFNALFKSFDAESLWQDFGKDSGQMIIQNYWDVTVFALLPLKIHFYKFCFSKTVCIECNQVYFVIFRTENMSGR